MSSPPASPPAPTAAAQALAHLFDSPTPPRPAPGARGRPGNSALFLNSPTSSAGGGSPAPRSRDPGGPSALDAGSGRGRESASVAPAAARGGVSRTDALALFDGLDFDDPLLDDDVNGTGAGGDDMLDPAVAAGLGKRVVPKIDEQRLLGDQGISNLVKTAKTLKFKGKGREAEDLNNLMNHYHVWAHTLFPKSKFSDTIKTVEKVCKKRNMLSSIQRFKLEYDPPAPLSPSPPPQPRTGDSPLPDVTFASSRVRSSRSTSPSGRRSLFSRGASDENEDDGGRRRAPGRAEAVARALAATAGGRASDDDGDDFDMDDMIRQAEEDVRLAADEMAHAGGGRPSSSSSTSRPVAPPPAPARAGAGADADEDEEMDIDWAELDAIDAEIAAGGVGGSRAPSGSSSAAKAAPAARAPPPPAPPPPPPPPATAQGDAGMDEEDDWSAFDELHG